MNAGCKVCIFHYTYKGKDECVMNDRLNPYKCPDYDYEERSKREQFGDIR